MGNARAAETEYPKELPGPTLKLKGQNCRCMACGLYFRRVSVFDKHRYGPYVQRGCYTGTQLVEKGWKQDTKGFWRGPGPKNPIGVGTFA